MMSKDDQKWMAGECPASLAVCDSVQRFRPEQLYLGTRLGVGNIDCDGWMKCPLEDVLIFLG